MLFNVLQHLSLGTALHVSSSCLKSVPLGRNFLFNNACGVIGDCGICWGANVTTNDCNWMTTVAPTVLDSLLAHIGPNIDC